jgi:hypothetical protein
VPTISGGTFPVSNAQDLGINSCGCVVANFIDVNFVVSGSSYNFAITKCHLLVLPLQEFAGFLQGG